MFTFFLTAALLGLFAATVVAVFAACLEVFDWVCSKLSGAFKALKVLVKGTDGKVTSGTLVQRGNKYEFYGDPEKKSVNEIDVDQKLKDAFAQTMTMNNGERMIEFKPDAETEREIRRRSA